MTPFDLRCWELLDQPAFRGSEKLVYPLVASHKFLMNATILDAFAEYGDMLVSKRLFRLPFEAVLFEYKATENDDGVDRVCLLGAEIEKKASNGSNLIIVPFARHRDDLWSGGTEFSIYLSYDDAEWRFSRAFTTTDTAWRDQHGLIVDAFAGSVAMLSSDKFVQTPVHASERLHRARERRGKTPVFSYTVVSLPTTRGERIDRGGTHASPALHWRRGHLRNLGNRIVPVAPCLVGSPENGVVVKDYDGRMLTEETI